MTVLGVDIGGTKIAAGFVNFAAGAVNFDAGALNFDDGSEQPADALASWLAGIVNLLDPGIIVLGGGVLDGREGRASLVRLRELVPRRTVNPHAAVIPILPAHFGAQAGLVGAAMIGAAGVGAG